MDVTSQPLTYIQEQLGKGTLSCAQLVRGYLEVIKENEGLNAFLSVYADESLERAAEIDNKIANKNAGKLAGLVVGLKDVIAFKDHPVTAASKILGSFHAPYHATVVERLLREDAIIIGRQNCDEFGMGSSTENSAYGPSRNPVDWQRTPGGSSGGSAAAVAARMCSVAIGSDTGGSVRQPAAFCGVYGLKPTYGRISRHGLIAYASSFDTIGLLAAHPGDLARVLTVVAGADEFDSTVSQVAVPDFEKTLAGQSPYRVAILNNALQTSGLQAEVRESIEEASRQLRSLGHIVDTVEFPFMDYVLPAYYLLATAEASSNLSRYDGVRYGYRADSSGTIESMYKQSRSEGFGKEVKRRILLGTFVLSADYHDAYYVQAQKVRRLIRNETIRLLDRYDVLLTPTTPTTAYPLGSVSDPMTMYLGDIFSVLANVSGVPAISIPYGKDRVGLPIGLQALAPNFREDILLAFARIMSVDR